MFYLAAFTIFTTACAGAPQRDPFANVFSRPPSPAAPATDEGSLPIAWQGGGVAFSDEQYGKSEGLWGIGRLSARMSLGKRLGHGRTAAVRCRCLSEQPVYVEFTPLDGGPQDAWAATTAAWSPRQGRDYAGPGWERGCQAAIDDVPAVGVLIDSGWLGKVDRAGLGAPDIAKQVAATWPGSRPWAGGVPVYLPGQAWIDAVAEARGVQRLFGDDRIAAGQALLVGGSCRAALIGAEWVAHGNPGADAARKAAVEAITAHPNVQEIARPRDALVAVLTSCILRSCEDFDWANPGWRENPLFVASTQFPQAGVAGVEGNRAGRGLPVDPIAWGDACDLDP